MQPFRAISLKLFSVMIFITMISMIKATADTVPPGQAVFFRSAFAIPVICGWLMMRGELRTGLRAISPLGHLWRGLIGTTAMGLMFASLGYLPLPEVTALSYAAPLLTVVFAAVLLGERLRLFRITAVGLGLVGVLVVLEPRLTMLSSGQFEPEAAFGAGLVLLAAGCIGLAQIHIRKLVQTEHPAAIAFYFSLTSTIAALLTAPFGWAALSQQTALLLIAAGVLGGVGQICLTLSFRYAPVTVVAPFEYASMLFALLIGYFVFAEVPSLQMLIGAAIVIAAGGLIIWREAQLGLERGKARALKTPHG